MVRSPCASPVRVKDGFDRGGWILLAGLTALSAAMRFYRLDSVPAGLDLDEAFNGLDALSLRHLPLTEWPIVFQGLTSEREPLFIWLSGVAHAIFGPSIWTARCVAALSGSLLTAALAWLGWEAAPILGVRYRQQFALWCATVALALLWSQIFSRYGIRAILFVLVQTLLWAAMWRAWQRPPPAMRAWLMTGFLAGLSLYTYLPARLLPLVLLPLLASAIASHSQRLRQHLPGIVCGVFIAVLVMAPLIYFFLQNQSVFFNRIEQVAVLEPRAVWSNLSSALQMFILSGDLNSRDNVSARPAFDPLLAIPFVIGIGAALFRFWSLGRIFLLTGLIVQLLPTVFSSNAPSFLRAIGVIPFAILITALGAERVDRLFERMKGKVYWPARGAVWAVFAASIALTNWTYFGVWASSPELFYEYDEGFVRLAREIADEREAAIYVNTHGGLRQPSLFYMLTAFDAEARFYDGQECLPIALSGPVRHFYLADSEFRSKLQSSSHYEQAMPHSTVISDRTGKPWLAETKSPGGPIVFPEMRKHEVQMGDGISLAGYSLSQERIRPGSPLGLRLFWQASERPSVDWTTLIHLVKLEEDGNPTRLAGFDRRPGDGNCPTIDWLPGEVIIDDIVLSMPATLPEEELFLAVGFYSVSDGALHHLPIVDSVDYRIILGPLSDPP